MGDSVGVCSRRSLIGSRYGRRRRGVFRIRLRPYIELVNIARGVHANKLQFDSVMTALGITSSQTVAKLSLGSTLMASTLTSSDNL